jgi:hypothetical protein
MSPQQIVAVGARLLAVWLFAHLPGQVYQFYAFVVAGVDTASASLRVFTACALIFEVLLVLALWFFPLTIARKFLRSSSAELPAPSSPDAWLGMGCALIGLWLLTTSLPALVLNVYVLVGADNNYAETTSLRHDVSHNVFYNSAEVAIGLWLILGARGFRELFWWARNAGVSKPLN